MKTKTIIDSWVGNTLMLVGAASLICSALYFVFFGAPSYTRKPVKQPTPTIPTTTSTYQGCPPDVSEPDLLLYAEVAKNNGSRQYSDNGSYTFVDGETYRGKVSIYTLNLVDAMSDIGALPSFPFKYISVVQDVLDICDDGIPDVMIMEGRITDYDVKIVDEGINGRNLKITRNGMQLSDSQTRILGQIYNFYFRNISNELK